MHSKIVAAFIVGALMASGIVYIAIRPSPQKASLAGGRGVSEILPPPSAPAAQTATVAAAARPDEKPARAPVPDAKPVPEPKPAQHTKLSRAPLREKPSPMPAPVHREKPAVVARNEPPIETPPPAPAAPATPESQRAPQPESAQPVAAQPTPQPAAQEPAPAPPPPPSIVAKSVPEPEARVSHSVVLAAGTPLTVRIGENLSAARNQAGDTFFATLEQQLVIDGFIIADRGSRVIGKVVEAVPAGRGGGESHLRIELIKLNTTDGQHIPVKTDPYAKDGAGSPGGDLAKIGAGAAIGAAIGAIAGGGKGAAIGAGAGAAAGTGAVLISNGRSVEIPVEARLTFRVKDSIRLTEKLD